MIVYQSTKKSFLRDSSTGIEDIIRDRVKEKLNIDVKPGSSEYESWKNSLGNAMHHVMNTDKIPDDSGVAIEYSIPRSKNRIDFLITGENENGQENVVIVRNFTHRTRHGPTQHFFMGLTQPFMRRK